MGNVLKHPTEFLFVGKQQHFHHFRNKEHYLYNPHNPQQRAEYLFIVLLALFGNYTGLSLLSMAQMRFIFRKCFFSCYIHR